MEIFYNVILIEVLNKFIPTFIKKGDINSVDNLKITKIPNKYSLVKLSKSFLKYQLTIRNEIKILK